MKLKKLLPSLGTLMVVSAPISLVIACSSIKTYDVNVSTVSTSRYVVTRLDTAQNKPVEVDSSKMVWDINNNDDTAKRIIDKYIGAGAINNVIATINGSPVYDNGLEKLAFDLLAAEKNGPTLNLIFPNKKVVIFQETFLDATREAKKNILLDLTTENLKDSLENIALYNKTDNAIKKTTWTQWVSAVNKMFGAK